METPDTGYADAGSVIQVVTFEGGTLESDWVSTQIDQRHTMHAAGHTMGT